MGKFYREVGEELTPVVQYIAWLNAQITDKNKTLAERQERKTRRAEMEEKGIDLGIPDVSAPFLISYLLEIGPVVAAGLGPAAISWRDIRAWSECTGIYLMPWQSRLLVELSKEYLSFSRKAEEPDCLSPLSDEVKKIAIRDAINRSLKIGFKALMISSRPRRSKAKRK